MQKEYAITFVDKFGYKHTTAASMCLWGVWQDMDELIKMYEDAGLECNAQIVEVQP
jgi:hypothetical protein